MFPIFLSLVRLVTNCLCHFLCFWCRNSWDHLIKMIKQYLMLHIWMQNNEVKDDTLNKFTNSTQFKYNSNSCNIIRKSKYTVTLLVQSQVSWMTMECHRISPRGVGAKMARLNQQLWWSRISCFYLRKWSVNGRVIAHLLHQHNY